MIARSDCLQLLQQHQPTDPSESADIRRALELVSTQEQFWQADNQRSHLTASCWVLSPDLDAILLLHHRKLSRWLQPGGHIEKEDHSWVAAATREAREETGIRSFKLLQESIFDFDIHSIPARGNQPQHEHFDARFLLQAETSQLTLSEASNQLRWFTFAEAAEILQGEAVMQRMISKSTNASEFAPNR